MQIIIGNFGLSHDQERVQMGVWCMVAAPLLLSNDLRNIRKSSRDLILNKRLLAINQDPLGIQALAFKLVSLDLFIDIDEIEKNLYQCNLKLFSSDKKSFP